MPNEYFVHDLTDKFEKTNIVPKDEYKKYILKTTEFIIEHLKNICGPLANNVMFVLPEASGRTNRVFSKDGINMLNAIEFHNPIQKDIVNAITDIGKAIDLSAGDGTTSSMLFASIFLYNLYTNNLSNVSSISIQEIKNTYTTLTSFFHEQLNKYLVTIDKLETLYPSDNIRYNLIYKQILHSTHGNKYFAKIISDLLEYIPNDRLDSISYTEAKRSDTPELEIFYPDYDYMSDVYCHTPFSNNDMFGTELLLEDVQLIFLYHLNHESIQRIYYDTSNKIDKDKNTIIFATKVDTVDIQKFFNDTFFTKTLSVFSLIGMGAEKRSTSLQEHIILSIAKSLTQIVGITNQDVISITSCDKIHFKFNKNMYFYGLIPETNTNQHPYYLDKTDEEKKEHFYYHSVLHKFSEYIIDIKQSPTPMKQELQWFEDCINSLIIVRKPKLILGGGLQNRNNNKDAFHDAVKSLLPILTEGFYVNIWEVLFQILNTYEIDENDSLLIHYKNIFLQSLQQLLDIIKSNTANYCNIIKYPDHEQYFTFIGSKILFPAEVPMIPKILIDVLFEKLLNIIMMKYISFVVHYQAIYDPKEQDKIS
jgi:hypothetical protein